MKYVNLASAVFLLLSIGPAMSWAQDQSDGSPKRAGKAYPALELGNNAPEDQSSDAVQPDSRPLTGFQEPTVGIQQERHSYWIPGISYVNSIRSNALSQGGDNGWNSTSYVAGNLSLLQTWSRSQLSLNYSGGGVFSSDSSVKGGQFHQVGAVQTFDWRRWQLTLLDEFAYLPESEFGFGAGTGIANPGVGGPLAVSQPGLQSSFNPSQSVFTAVGSQYTNSSGVQVNFLLTPRSSVTFGGVAGILRFIEKGNIESNQLVLNAGYNYQVSKTDSIGVSYRFSAYHYMDFPQAIGDHTVQAVYGRKITGRLALQLSGGPDITNFRVATGTNPKTQYVSGTASANLSYAFRTGMMSLNYTHGINNGSGVFLGATSDQLTGTATRKLSRVWSGNASLGYARNKSAASSGAQNQTYNTLYVGAGLERPLSREVDLTFSYTANIQTSNGTVCAGTNCSSSNTTHVIGLGFTWQARPLVLH